MNGNSESGEEGALILLLTNIVAHIITLPGTSPEDRKMLHDQLIEFCQNQGEGRAMNKQEIRRDC